VVLRIISALVAFGMLVVPVLAEAQESSGEGGEWEGDPVPAYVVTASMDPEVDSVAARIGAAARAALRGVARVDGSLADQAYLGYDDATAAQIESGYRLLEEGRQAYLDLELELAIERLSASVAAFDRGAAALEDVSGLGDALLYLGASQVFARRTSDARGTFTRLHVQLPQIRPDEEVFNPDVVSRYAAARPRDAGNPRSVLRAESEPPGATLYVDGIVRGRTPMNVTGLVGGEHVVRMVQPGATPFIERVEVRRGRTATVSAFLLEAEGMESLAESLENLPTDSDDRPDRNGPTVQIGEILGVGHLGVIRVSPHGEEGRATVELLLFDTTNRRRLLRMHGPIEVAQGSLEASIRELVTRGFEAAIQPQQQTDTEDILAQTRVPEPDEGAPRRSGGLLKQWWFWTAIGGAVAVGVTVGVLVGGDSGPGLGSDPTGTVVFDF